MGFPRAGKTLWQFHHGTLFFTGDKNGAGGVLIEPWEGFCGSTVVHEKHLLDRWDVALVATKHDGC